MDYAEVVVSSPRSRSTFCYAIPPRLNIAAGQAVWVPFGPRIIQGIVIELSDRPSVEATREIADIITDQPLLSPAQIKLARWVSERYMSPLFDAIALMLPPGFERKLITYFQITKPEEDFSSFTSEQRQLLYLMRERGKISLKEVERTIGVKKARQITNQLLQQHLITKTQELEKTKIRPKLTPYVKLLASKSDVEGEIARLNKSRAYKQVALLEFLNKQGQPMPASQVRKCLNCSYEVFKALESRNLISIEMVKVRRDPLSHLSLTFTPPPILTSSQQAAWNSIKELMTNSHQLSVSPLVFLLFGVTGSGKTEIYLKALANVIAMGKRGICLIPEIALASQTVERFANRFPGRVAILHSGLSPGEQFDEWQWIKEGNCDVVIGPRSALFAPQPDLGLVIIDEEHEWTYKQEDKSPRYHARDVAVKLAELCNAAVILGSATPDINSFYKAQSGEYHLIELKERITPHGYSALPEVEIVDMKEELKVGNRSLFSRALIAAMRKTLAQGEQIILFLNRRGTATLIQCLSCGFVFHCPHCSVALTYHSAERKLMCHRCHYQTLIPQTCPQCFSHHLKFLGIGTQRVEEEVRHLFPEVKLLRWDRDVTLRRHAHEELLANFGDHKADILIGTQMIAKGLDLPQVTLAGIINADTGLNLPDFRAGERTFQLLCQVAGRAGRGVRAGRVIIQTYTPENYAVRAAVKHDYRGFYNQEINYRRQYDYPPFSQFIRLVYTHTNDELCHREVDRISHSILNEKENKGIIDLHIIGPIPAFASKVRGKYRWQLILRGHNPAQVLSDVSLPQGWTIDVDPVGII